VQLPKNNPLVSQQLDCWAAFGSATAEEQSTRFPAVVLLAGIRQCNCRRTIHSFPSSWTTGRHSAVQLPKNNPLVSQQLDCWAAFGSATAEKQSTRFPAVALLGGIRQCNCRRTIGSFPSSWTAGRHSAVQLPKNNPLVSQQLDCWLAFGSATAEEHEMLQYLQIRQARGEAFDAD
jgi:hypothetical protein